MNVLIVDDDIQVCRTLYTIVSRKHNTSILSNGHNAVACLADPAHGFDLVMIDINMPRLSGKDVIDVLKDIVDVNFVIITGDPNVAPALRKYDVLQKPFDMNTLLEWLDDFEGRCKNRKPKTGNIGKITHVPVVNAKPVSAAAVPGPRYQMAF